MRLLFVFNTPGFLRYFDTTIEQLLDRGHEVVLTFQRPDLRPESLEILDLDNPRLTIIEECPSRSDRYAKVAGRVRAAADYIRYLDPKLKDLEFLRTRQRARSLRMMPSLSVFGDRRSIWGPAARTLVKFFLACERALPSAPEIETFISEIGVDAVLVSPLVTSASPQVDYVKSAQALGIPGGLCVASWDNLTNKGLMRVRPDRVFVWNETQRDEAVRLHGVPRRRVVLTGAQPFDRWFGREPHETRDHFCRKVGLDPSRPYVIFVGSSSNIARENVEETFARRWIEQLRGSSDDLLREIGVLVRPHPDRRGEWGEVDLEGIQNATLWPPERPNSVAPDARADYFDSLFHSAAVVGINTSAMIEGAIIGRPVLTIRAPEFEESQKGTIHFRYLLPENGGFLLVADDYPEHVHQLADAVRHPDVARELNERFLERFIRPRGIDQPCTNILAGELEEFARAGRSRPARIRPTLYPLKALLSATVTFRSWRAQRRDAEAILARGERRALRLRRRAALVRPLTAALATRLEHRAESLRSRAQQQTKDLAERRKAERQEARLRSRAAKQHGRDLLERGLKERQAESEELNV